MSNRVMKILEKYTPNIEFYSIDEAFLQFKGFDFFDVFQEGVKIQIQIKKWTGIPVSIGLAPSKSLAKIANKIAKKFNQRTQGVYCIDTEEKKMKALKWTQISHVWGIGRQHTKHLESLGVKNALDFINLPDNWVKKNMSIVGLRLKKDLQGIPFINLEEVITPKKGISTTRSFEKTLCSFNELEERVSTFAKVCAEKIRKQNSSCNSLLMFVKSDPYKKNITSYNNSCLITLPYATNSTLTLSKYAVLGLKKIFREKIYYKKAGVILMDLVPTKNRQLNLFNKNIAKHDVLMKVLDQIDYRFGPNKMKIANQDLKRTWKMKQEHLSKRFTTNIKEIIQVK